MDGTLIYTDCLELDNRIGYLQLPSLNYYREEPLLVTLPLNYAGKTLTIAQAADPETETDLTVTPCAVTLYCGYTYESALIAESFQTAIPTTLAFAVGVLLLGLFVWKAARKGPDPTLVCGALAAFLYLGSQMVSPSFFNAYFHTPPVDLGMLCRELALMNLLGLLLCKLSGWRRAPVWVALGGMGASLLAELVLALLGQAGVFARENGFALFGIAGLLAALVGGFWELRQGGWFFRVFCPVATAGIGLAGLAYGMALLTSGVWADMLETQLATWTFGYFLWRLMALCMVPAFLGAVVELIHEEIAARTEAHLLAQRTELALSSYQALLQHNEQVMMLRHDMAKHFQLLRQMTGEGKVAAYLDGLIGQNEKIRPVVQSGNEMLDIILNSKLFEAADREIAVELVRIQAPERLSLSDTEFCSLVMNLMDNAIEAASTPGMEHSYIKLDFYRRDHFFVLSCENACTLDWANRKPAPERGLGLKIIGQIAMRHENLLEIETGKDFYRVILAIPLD